MKQRFEKSNIIPKRIRRWRWLSVIMIAFFLHSCQSSSDSSDDTSNPAPQKTHTDVSFQVSMPDSSMSAGAARSAALGTTNYASSTVSDVVNVLVEVKHGDEVLIAGQELVKTNDQWGGTLENLPVGVNLTFNAWAKDNTDTDIYVGTTMQLLTGENDVVSVKLSTGNLSITLPRITQIVLPAEIIVSNTTAIQTSVEGRSGEPLNYSYSPAADGGTFLPASGSSGNCSSQEGA